MSAAFADPTIKRKDANSTKFFKYLFIYPPKLIIMHKIKMSSIDQVFLLCYIFIDLPIYQEFPICAFYIKDYFLRDNRMLKTAASNSLNRKAII